MDENEKDLVLVLPMEIKSSESEFFTPTPTGEETTVVTTTMGLEETTSTTTEIPNTSTEIVIEETDFPETTQWFEYNLILEVKFKSSRINFLTFCL